MKLQFAIFISIISTILSLATFYVVVRLLDSAPFLAPYSQLVWLATVLFVALQILGPFLYRTYPSRRLLPLMGQWIVYTSLGTLAVLFFYTLFFDVLGWTGLQFSNRFEFVVYGTALTVLVGVAQALAGPKLRQIEIQHPRLPADFDGLKIAQISDLHVGPIIGRRYVQNVVRMTMGQNPNLILLTGDLQDGQVETLRDDFAPLRDLRAPLGVYSIIGNHELYWGVKNWIQEFRAMGLNPLINEHRLLSRSTSQICLVGLSEISAGRMNADLAMNPALAFPQNPENDLFHLVMAHQPSSFDRLGQYPVDLQLSGHTHGGQFFPWNLVVYIAQRYVRGLYKKGDRFLFVHAGTGFWGPPLRFLVPAEVCLITLRSSSSRTPHGVSI